MKLRPEFSSPLSFRVAYYFWMLCSITKKFFFCGAFIYLVLTMSSTHIVFVYGISINVFYDEMLVFVRILSATNNSISLQNLH